MTESSFVTANEQRWHRFEQLLSKRAGQRFKDGADPVDFPKQYRALCRDLNLARARRYSLPLVERLNSLVWKGHYFLYQSRGEGWFRAVALLIHDFPSTVRRFAIPILLCHVLFYGAAGITFLYTFDDRERAVAIVGEEAAENMLDMYDPGEDHFLRPRGVENDADMFGFYIYNNISVGFRTFASGGLAGIGSLFYILFNAVSFGAVAGLLVNAGFGHTFFPFVIGHGSFELTAILIFGLAGFLLGGSIIAPGRMSRAEALKKAGTEVLPLLAGATLFLFFAAAIEAFWSASVIPASTKYLIGAGLWAFVFLFLIFGGRNAHRKI